MLTGKRLQYLADLLPENVSWGDPLNAVMLDQILTAHSAGAEEPEWCERCGYPCKCAQPQPMPQTDAAQKNVDVPERQRGESFSDWAKRVYEWQDAQPMPQTDAARDAEDAKRYRFIKSQMKVGAVQTQLPLYRTLHWIGYEDCSDVHSADAAIDAEIERLDGAKGE